MSASNSHHFSHDIYEEVAYVYDGSIEGLLSAIFASYANHENPSDVVPEELFQPRLGQRVCTIATNESHAERVRRSICEKCGNRAFRDVLKASLSSDPQAGTAAYKFVRYSFDEILEEGRNCSKCRKAPSCRAKGNKRTCPKKKAKAISDITHPDVEGLFKISRAVSQEEEHIRQFARFNHVVSDDMDFWFAKINPRDSVVPLIMGHFVERFNIQAFMIYDEAHDLIGVYDGKSQYFVKPDNVSGLLGIDNKSSDEAEMQEAWKRFYRVVSIESRYNPELRRSLMPKRFWKNLTEMN